VEKLREPFSDLEVSKALRRLREFNDDEGTGKRWWDKAFEEKLMAFGRITSGRGVAEAVVQHEELKPKVKLRQLPNHFLPHVFLHAIRVDDGITTPRWRPLEDGNGRTR
jgi:hypothetical protein